MAREEHSVVGQSHANFAGALRGLKCDQFALPPVEITEDVSDDAELAQLEVAREQLIERVTRKAAEDETAD